MDCRVHLLTSQQLQHEVEELQQSCDQLREQLVAEVGHRKALEERHRVVVETLEASLENTHTQGMVACQQAIRDIQISLAEKDRQMQELSAMTLELQQTARELHQGLADQVQGADRLSRAVRELFTQVLQPMQSEWSSMQKYFGDLARELRKACQRSQAERAEMQRHLGLHQAELSGMKEMVQRWKQEAEQRGQEVAELRDKEAEEAEKLKHRRRREEHAYRRDQVKIIEQALLICSGTGGPPGSPSEYGPVLRLPGLPGCPPGLCTLGG